jgi:hypothetical protein
MHLNTEYILKAKFSEISGPHKNWLRRQLIGNSFNAVKFLFIDSKYFAYLLIVISFWFRMRFLNQLKYL